MTDALTEATEAHIDALSKRGAEEAMAAAAAVIAEDPALPQIPIVGSALLEAYCRTMGPYCKGDPVLIGKTLDLVLRGLTVFATPEHDA
jgi:hypothetical protein